MTDGRFLEQSLLRGPLRSRSRGTLGGSLLHRLPRSALASSLGFLSLMTACQKDSLTLESKSLADSTHPLYDLSADVLSTEEAYRALEISLSCPNEEDSDCLLRVWGGEKVLHGPASNLLLQLVIPALAAPGALDLSASEAEPWNVPPVVYAVTENVDETDAAPRYDFDCRQATGSIHLTEVPLIGGRVQLDFDLNLDCVESLLPTEPVPLHLWGLLDGRVSREG